MSEFVQVTVSAGSKLDAERIARSVVENRLAACAQVLGPMQSVYWWQGAVETAEEWLCLLKTSAAKYAALEAAVKSAHPYDTPEIIATPIVDGSKPYLDWLRKELHP